MRRGAAAATGVRRPHPEAVGAGERARDRQRGRVSVGVDDPDEWPPRRARVRLLPLRCCAFPWQRLDADHAAGAVVGNETDREAGARDLDRECIVAQGHLCDAAIAEEQSQLRNVVARDAGEHRVLVAAEPRAQRGREWPAPERDREGIAAAADRPSLDEVVAEVPAGLRQRVQRRLHDVVERDRHTQRALGIGPDQPAERDVTLLGPRPNQRRHPLLRPPRPIRRPDQPGLIHLDHRVPTPQRRRHLQRRQPLPPRHRDHHPPAKHDRHHEDPRPLHHHPGRKPSRSTRSSAHARPPTRLGRHQTLAKPPPKFTPLPHSHAAGQGTAKTRPVAARTARCTDRRAHILRTSPTH